MRILPVSAVAVLGALCLVACGNKSGGSTTGASTAATTSNAKSTASPSGSSKVAAAGVRKGAKNTPKVKPESAKKLDVIKRDLSELTKPIPKDAGKVDSKVLKGAAEAAPKKVEDAPENACTGVADHQAKCAGAKLLFCEGEEEYELDCDEDARMSGWVGGWCQEAGEQVACVDYAYDPNAPPPEDEINCAYDDEGVPYYCCTSITNYCWAP